MFSPLFSDPFYEGAGASSDRRFPVAINGRPYKIDEEQGIVRQSIPMLRPQADTGEVLGEQSLTASGAWPRGQDSWHLGSGQTFLDRDGSDRARFRSSKGVDPWTKWQLSLLPDTTLGLSSANTNLRLTTAGTYAYVTDGQVLKYSTNGTSWTSVTGHPAVTPTSLTSDGYTVFTAYGASGVYSTTRGAAAQTQLTTTGTFSLVGYVKGRLMAANTNSIYNIISMTPTTGPSALYAHPNTDFTWVAFAEGQTCLYAAGYSGDKSVIYKTAVKADGTALDIPTVAGELPDGEIVRSMQRYLDLILIGSDKGVRLATADGDGNLTIAALIPTASAVECMEPQDRFVWYGLTNYDATSTGLGRMDLSSFTATLTPAYASDLMATGQGAVLSAITLAAKRVFTVSGLGVYLQSANLVSTGTLDTGLITYGQPYDKLAVSADVRTAALAGSVTVSISADSGAFQSLGTENVAGTTGATFAARQLTGAVFEMRHTLTRDAVTTTGPALTRWTLRAYPAAPGGEQWTVPLLLYSQVEIDGGDHYFDVDAEIDFLVNLRETRTFATYQEGDRSHQVVVEDYTSKSHHKVADRTYAVVFTVTLKSLAES